MVAARRILVVEDEPSVADAITYALSTEGYAPTRCGTGAECLDASAATGNLVTRPFRFTGDKLSVNLHAPNGRLVAELQDESGKPLEGFAAADSTPTTGDGVALLVRWRNATSLSGLGGKTVRLKLELTNGALYGFRFAV